MSGFSLAVFIQQELQNLQKRALLLWGDARVGHVQSHAVPVGMNCRPSIAYRWKGLDAGYKNLGVKGVHSMGNFGDIVEKRQKQRVPLTSRNGLCVAIAHQK